MHCKQIYPQMISATVLILGLVSCSSNNEKNPVFDKVDVEVHWSKNQNLLEQADEANPLSIKTSEAIYIQSKGATLSQIKLLARHICLTKSGERIEGQSELATNGPIQLVNLVPKSFISWPEQYWEQLTGCYFDLEFSNSTGSLHIHRSPFIKPLFDLQQPQLELIGASQPQLGNLQIQRIVENDLANWYLRNSNQHQGSTQIICEHTTTQQTPATPLMNLALLPITDTNHQVQFCRAILWKDQNDFVYSPLFEVQRLDLEVSTKFTIRTDSFRLPLHSSRPFAHLEITNNHDHPIYLRWPIKKYKEVAVQIHTNKGHVTLPFALSYNINFSPKYIGVVPPNYHLKLPAKSSVVIDLDQMFNFKCRLDKQNNEFVLGYYVWMTKPLSIERIEYFPNGDIRHIEHLIVEMPPAWHDSGNKGNNFGLPAQQPPWDGVNNSSNNLGCNFF